jgi:hypothetical protein
MLHYLAILIVCAGVYVIGFLRGRRHATGLSGEEMIRRLTPEQRARFYAEFNSIKTLGTLRDAMTGINYLTAEAGDDWDLHMDQLDALARIPVQNWTRADREAYEKHARQLKRLQAFHDVLYPLFLRLQARFDKEGEYAEYICDQNKDF